MVNRYRSINGMMVLVWCALLLVLIIAACGEDDEPDNPPEPTIEATLEEPTEIAQEITPTTIGPSLTPSPTFPPTVTPRPTQGPATNLPTAVPTETLGPIEHVIRDGDSCSLIAAIYDTGVAAIRELNGLNQGCIIGSPGQVILVPRATQTPTPPAYDITLTVQYESLPPSLKNVTPYAVYTLCPEEGDTLTSMALENGTTNQRLCEMNPLPDGLDCRGCDFSESAVGRCDIPPPISIFACYNVPGPTHTPTFTPTFSGMETATPTPTYMPPQAIQPVNGSTVQGDVYLTWLSVGELKDNELYQLSVVDETTGENFIDTTRNPDYRIDNLWKPAAGQSRNILWSVEVVVQNEAGLYIPVSDRSFNSRFVWEGR